MKEHKKLLYLMIPFLLLSLGLSACRNNGTTTLNAPACSTLPIAVAQSLLVPFNGSTALTLVGTSSCGNLVSYALASSPLHGTLSGTIPNLTYTPASGYTGLDSFSFVVIDISNQKTSLPATVSITVTGNGALFWYSPASAANHHWATVGNWWLDFNHTVPANRAPQNNDYVYILRSATTSIFDDNAPAITLNAYVGCAPNNALRTQNITVASGGQLVVNSAGCLSSAPPPCSGSISAYWGGTANAGADVLFTECASNEGQILGNATFYDGYHRVTGGSGRIFGDAVFHGSGDCGIGSYGPIDGSAIFNNASLMGGGTVGANATFTANCFNSGTVSGSATFSDTTYNNSTVSVNAIFTGSSTNFGTINGDASFFDSAINFNGASVERIAAFDGETQNQGKVAWAVFTKNGVNTDTGVVTNDAEFNETAANKGSVDGNAIFNNNSINTLKVGGNAIFNGESVHDSTADVGGSATFNDSSNRYGSVGGSLFCNTTGSC